MPRLDAERAERFRRVHELKSVDALAEGDLVTVIEQGLHGNRVVEADLDEFVPTDNAARPKSILVGDCVVKTADGDVKTLTVELQCVEEHDHHEAETRDDGTIAIPVGGETDSMYRYDTVDVRTV